MFANTRPKIKPAEKPQISVAKKPPRVSQKLPKHKPNNFNKMTLSMLQKEAEAHSVSQKIGYIFTIGFFIPHYPTNLVHVLVVGRNDFRYFPTFELAKGFRMLHDLEPET